MEKNNESRQSMTDKYCKNCDRLYYQSLKLYHRIIALSTNLESVFLSCKICKYKSV